MDRSLEVSKHRMSTAIQGNQKQSITTHRNPKQSIATTHNPMHTKAIRSTVAPVTRQPCSEVNYFSAFPPLMQYQARTYMHHTCHLMSRSSVDPRRESRSGTVNLVVREFAMLCRRCLHVVHHIIPTIRRQGDFCICDVICTSRHFTMCTIWSGYEVDSVA